MNKITPKDFFINVGAIVALYVSAISLMTLLFQVINVAFPDALAGYVDPYSSGIRWAVASLIIVFPLFIFLSWLLEKEYHVDPSKRTLGIKRWLTYITLFLTGIAIATDLIVLINSFLGGEVTARFFLKVAVVFVVTGAIFGYYLWDLRRGGNVQIEDGTTRSKRRMFAIIAAVAVLVSIVGGFIVMGSPATQRKMRFDAQKTGDLQSIQWQIVNYWQQKRALPTGLADLNDPISSFMVPNDPQTGAAYIYRKVSDLTFELCADFNVETAEASARAMEFSYAYPMYGDFKNTNWQHGVGQACFERTIDPELYPPQILPTTGGVR